MVHVKLRCVEADAICRDSSTPVLRKLVVAETPGNTLAYDTTLPFALPEPVAPVSVSDTVPLALLTWSGPLSELGASTEMLLAALCQPPVALVTAVSSIGVIVPSGA